MSKTRIQNPMVEWKSISWRKLERHVFKLQKRIFKASQRGDVKVVKKLQKTLMRSWSAKCLAVRRVTQDNQGKKTAGVDGVKSLLPEQRLELAINLELSSKAKPTRRVWIPKPGTQEKRPLGIPTMTDRASQALVKQALEPQWEAIFEPNSMGFRPGRSAHDAIAAIFGSISRKAKYVLDTDISKCFDRINHSKLLEKLNTFPTLRRQIKAWLKSGVLDNGSLFPTESGTPQGGVISPLLANIALHGLEEEIKRFSLTLPGRKDSNLRSLNLIRYADDLVVLHPDKGVILQCKQLIENWLRDMGLELKPSKTRITHTLKECDGNLGFKFLGFSIRQFPVGKTHSGCDTKGKKLGYKTLIKPNSENISRHKEKLSKIIKTHKASSQEVLINELNPVIRGWCNYYSTVVSKDVFTSIESWLYQQLRNWAEHRHPHKSQYWISNKYWDCDDTGWYFRTKGAKSLKLVEHDKTPIIRHIKVRGDKSPYDGDWIYWGTRMGQHPETNKRVSLLLKKQKGKCTECGLYFREGDVLEVDHLVPLSQKGKDEYQNLQLLHRHCHDTKTARDSMRYA
jgi:RNA-directed DNA polymerase